VSFKHTPDVSVPAALVITLWEQQHVIFDRQ
jgi:hypothetical protein